MGVENMNAHTGKFALVLGNGAYSPAWKLDSPPLDFKGMRDALVGLGFEVDGAPDLGFNEMNGAVDAFAEKLKIAARVQAALFYYSGHGCARQRQNYMFPIDFDDPTSAENRLLATQSVIDRISGARNQDFVKIILLDACRVDAEGAERYEARVEAAVQSKGVRGPDGALAALPIGEIRSRFTEMTGEANTFIAFAAAEGTQAQGTEKGLSLFTGALLRNFDAVDLPLTNLLSRVRVIIRRQKLEAANQQIAWDQSSLNQPFFFSPGSILLFALFAGNAMALVGLILPLVPYSLVLQARLPWSWAATAAILPLLSLAILLYGMQSVYTRLKGSFDVDADGPLIWGDHFASSLQKGVLGGYLGSLLGGLAIGVTYYLAWASIDRQGNGGYDPLVPFGQVLVETTLATALTACLL